MHRSPVGNSGLGVAEPAVHGSGRPVYDVDRRDSNSTSFLLSFRAQAVRPQSRNRDFRPSTTLCREPAG